MKKITRILAVAVGVSAALSFAGCQTETVPEGRVGIEFWYEADINTNPTFYELVRTYNDDPLPVCGAEAASSAVYS